MLMRPCVRYRRMSANLIAARPHAVSLVITTDNLNSGLYSAALGAPSKVRMRASVAAVSGRFTFIALSLSQLKLNAFRPQSRGSDLCTADEPLSRYGRVGPASFNTATDWRLTRERILQHVPPTAQAGPP